MKYLLSILAVLALNSAIYAADRPNIVWLISEDNSTHYMKMFDDHGTETPRIQELAAHGLQFNNAFINRLHAILLDVWQRSQTAC